MNPVTLDKAHPVFSMPEFASHPDLRLIIVGGKGGVGKTTVSSAIALYLAQKHAGNKRIFIISTDPAHSLGDSLGMSIGDTLTPVDWKSGLAHGLLERDADGTAGKPINLFALELNSGRLLTTFKENHRHVLTTLADRGTYFDQDDIANFFDLSLPGMDEVMAIMEVASILKSDACDLLILDTAPTGHTLRMLSLPAQMKKWVEVLDLMQQKHRFMKTCASRKTYFKDECDAFLDVLSADMDRVSRLLSDRSITRFIPVTIPEPMSIEETHRLVVALEEMNIPVKEMIVNRTAAYRDCPVCSVQYADQQPSLARIDVLFSSCSRIHLPLFPSEIHGRSLFSVVDVFDQKMETRDQWAGVHFSPTADMAYRTPDTRPPASIIRPSGLPALSPDLEFILFGGKGGVGKTTLAASAALHMARTFPDKKILIFSTDPAHSLSDAFDRDIGNTLKPIDYPLDDGQKQEKTNLFAMEINADALFEDFKASFKQDISALFDQFLGSGMDIRFDRQVMTELISLAPPGIDEIMALDKVMELRKENAFDLFILDTSPTGHLLRFLELPSLIRDWLISFFRLMLKYRGVVRLARAAEKALVLSRNIRRMQETLINPKRNAFIAVTIPESLAVLELTRLLSAIKLSKIPCHHVIVNMMVPPGPCPFCSVRRTQQQCYLEQIQSICDSIQVVQIPLSPHPIRGVKQLVSPI
ncbi:MAG: ArsA family ATPase [Deltaproteobacteria bacterium]|nr:ArsA family ATPase [Deltaproteobacteria bacterium]